MALFNLFRKKIPTGIRANTIEYLNNTAIVDVRGQTCPGYLLAINKAVETIKPETEIDLIITYPPCGDDVKAWCKERCITFLGLEEQDTQWVIKIKK